MNKAVQDKIESYEDLKVAQKAHELVKAVYAICRQFPKQEAYGLTSQLQRASVSVTSNIAEGFNRRTKPDKAHFYIMAQASVAEAQSQLKIARDVTYVTDAEYQRVINISIAVHKMLTSLIKVTLQ